MSVKLYTAYRVKPRVAKNPRLLWTWIRDTYERGEKEVANVLRSMYEIGVENVKVDSPEYQRALRNYEDEDLARLSVARDLVYKEYRTQANSSERNPYDFDVSLVIRELDGNLYLLPHCDMMVRDVLNFLRRDTRIEDFSYWNNVDPPDDMRSGAGYRRWKARGKVWDALEPNDNLARWRQFLVMEIMSANRYYQIDPYPAMTKRLRRDRAARTSSTAGT